EDDEGAKRSLAELEKSIAALEREYSDLEEKWKAEKASVAGSAGVKEELERAKLDLDAARRANDWERASELQYGRIPELERRAAEASAAPSGSSAGTPKKFELLRNSDGGD
ncbi:UNVERIFIED_CONTAM: type VI secretion system ATPase TssH, partial [Salmonella enterica subsp. enterica serovar Weltevreden]